MIPSSVNLARMLAPRRAMIALESKRKYAQNRFESDERNMRLKSTIVTKKMTRNPS